MKNAVLWILSVLVGVNLLLTLQISLKLTDKMPEQIARERAKSLPEFLTEELIAAYADELMEAYNSKDPDAVWQLMGSYARAELTKLELQKALDQLHSFAGPVVSTRYKYHEYAGQMGNLAFFKLFYRANLTEACQLTDNGTLTITIAIDGQNTQFAAFRIDADGVSGR